MHVSNEAPLDEAHWLDAQYGLKSGQREINLKQVYWDASN